MPRYERTFGHEVFNKAMNAARVSIEHIFGIVVDVQTIRAGQYYSRPHPKTKFEEVRQLVKRRPLVQHGVEAL